MTLCVFIKKFSQTFKEKNYCVNLGLNLGPILWAGNLSLGSDTP